MRQPVDALSVRRDEGERVAVEREREAPAQLFVREPRGALDPRDHGREQPGRLERQPASVERVDGAGEQLAPRPRDVDEHTTRHHDEGRARRSLRGEAGQRVGRVAGDEQRRVGARDRHGAAQPLESRVLLWPDQRLEP